MKLCIVAYLKTPPLGRRDGMRIFNDYSGYVFLLEFLTLAYLAGAKEVHEILGRRTCKRLSSSRQRTYFWPFISHTLATQAVLNGEL